MAAGEVRCVAFRNYDYGLIRMAQFITLLMSFTLYTSYGYLAIIHGQFENLN